MTKGGITKLIEALEIFKKYGDPGNPTHCEHDVLMVSIRHADVTEEDKRKLDELGFFPDDEYGYFKSYRFGSA